MAKRESLTTSLVLLRLVLMNVAARDFSIVQSASGSRSVPKRQRNISGNKDDISKVIDEMLARAGLTKTEAAARMGADVSGLVHMQHGTKTSAPGNGKTYRYERKPSVEWLARLASACGCQLVVRFPDISEKEIL